MVETDTELVEVQAWAKGIEAVQARVAGRFKRREPRQRVLAYLKGLLSRAQERLATGRARWRFDSRWSAALAGHLRLGC